MKVAFAAIPAALALTLSVVGAGCGGTTRLWVHVEGDGVDVVTSITITLVNGGTTGDVRIPETGMVTEALPLDLGLVLENAEAGELRACLRASRPGGDDAGGCNTTTLTLGARNEMDVALFVAGCGNNVWDTGESCDQLDLGPNDCTSLGLGPGELACDSLCMLDASDCGAPLTCGNGMREGDEDCEALDLGGMTCADFPPLNGGILSCNENCTFNVDACTSCGDATIDGDEECDGANLNGRDCVAEGFIGGTLQCSAACTFDTGACVGAMVCTPGELMCDPVDPQVLQVCDTAGSGPDPALDTICPVLCVDSATIGPGCAVASNVPDATASGCVGTTSVVVDAGQAAIFGGGAAPTLTPITGSAVTGTLIPMAGSPDLALFCVADLLINSGGSMVATAGTPWIPVVMANGDITIDGNVNISAGSSGVEAPGPGGGAGGTNMMTAEGPGAGEGSPGGTWAPGAGGAGFAVPGGAGGDSPSGLGGMGGVLIGSADLIPLYAGSGGGKGEQGTASMDAMDIVGGGGAGAIHFIARGTITVTGSGSINASASNGLSGDSCDDGGGGGGSGGAILLEAPVVDLMWNNAAVADGGNGGLNAWPPLFCTLPGPALGGTLTNPIPLPGADHMGEGAAGGAGAAGRVRVNDLSGSGCGPLPASCSSGLLLIP